MSTHKRRPGTGKSQAASDAATLIPTEIRELLGPSPVVDIAEEPIFDRLLAAAVNELNPSGMIEWTLVFDFTVTTWEIRQLREYKTSLLRVENVDISAHNKQDNSAPRYQLVEAFHAMGLNKQKISEISGLELLNRLAEYSAQAETKEVQSKQPGIKSLEQMSAGETLLDRASRLAKVISTNASAMDQLQRMTLMLEKRRDTLLRDLDRRQATRCERDSARPRHDRDATDIETRVDG